MKWSPDIAFPSQKENLGGYSNQKAKELSENDKAMRIVIHYSFYPDWRSISFKLYLLRLSAIKVIENIVYGFVDQRF